MDKRIAFFIIITLFPFSLVSCSSEPGKEKAKSTGEIIENYTETLTKAPQKARSAAEKETERDSAVDKEIKELDK